MRERLLVLMFVSASVAGLAAASGNWLETHKDKSSMDDGAKKQMNATVVSVDAENKTINFEELNTPVTITSATLFDEEVQLDKLKAGTKVKLVLVTNADNKAEAVEVRKAG